MSLLKDVLKRAEQSRPPDPDPEADIPALADVNVWGWNSMHPPPIDSSLAVTTAARLRPAPTGDGCSDNAQTGALNTLPVPRLAINDQLRAQPKPAKYRNSAASLRIASRILFLSLMAGSAYWLWQWIPQKTTLISNQQRLSANDSMKKPISTLALLTTTDSSAIAFAQLSSPVAIPQQPSPVANATVAFSHGDRLPVEPKAKRKPGSVPDVEPKSEPQSDKYRTVPQTTTPTTIPAYNDPANSNNDAVADGEPTVEGVEGADSEAIDPVRIASITTAEPASPDAASLNGVQPSNMDIRIIAQPPPKIETALIDAYAAFNRGDNDNAAVIYREILQQQPRNRDALLGLAAIHLRSGRGDLAAQLYWRQLANDPNDPHAQAALIDLRQGSDAGAVETVLKNLLQVHPDEVYLRYTLGNLYAEQQRWSEAQQAYFHAWSQQNRNSDYAYNLAVSLDHLGQTNAALSFYRLAVELSGSNQASFDPALVQQRIQAMVTPDTIRQ